VGIYIFKSKTGPYLKVGHTKRKNPWDRIEAHGGFASNLNPPGIRGKIGTSDLLLVGWYPHGSVEKELAFHRLYASEAVAGEWYSSDLEEHFKAVFRVIFGRSRHTVVENPKPPEAPVQSSKITTGKCMAPTLSGGRCQFPKGFCPHHNGQKKARKKNPLLTDEEWERRQRRRR